MRTALSLKNLIRSSLAGLAVIALVAGQSACTKKTSKTTPKSGKTKDAKGPRFQLTVVHKKGGDKLVVCKTQPGWKVITYDINRDLKKNIDIWKVFRDDGSLACREMDMDFDGKRDLAVKYYKNGDRREIWEDVDRDGQFDLIMHLRPDGTLERVEMDTNSDGKIDVWKRYRLNKDHNNVPYMVIRDRDYDGYRDYWERYDDKGGIDEISWTDPGAQNEKPKYWLSNPSQEEEGVAKESTSIPKAPAKSTQKQKPKGKPTRGATK
ncbi:MAG: hypothetical protein J7M25_07335 [Deltaproteobacteria bacterium]|nr:hypothetical protein [Deltaproteobacteria bacterium]